MVQQKECPGLGRGWGNERKACEFRHQRKAHRGVEGTSGKPGEMEQMGRFHVELSPQPTS